MKHITTAIITKLEYQHMETERTINERLINICLFKDN